MPVTNFDFSRWQTTCIHFCWWYSKTLNFTGDPKLNWSFFLLFTGWICLSEKKITTCMTKPAETTLKSGRHPPLFTDPIRPPACDLMLLGRQEGCLRSQGVKGFCCLVFWLVGWTRFFWGGNWLIMGVSTVGVLGPQRFCWLFQVILWGSCGFQTRLV